MHTIRVTAEHLKFIKGRTDASDSLMAPVSIRQLIADNGGLPELLKRVEYELCGLIDLAYTEAIAYNCDLDQIRLIGLGLVDSVTAEGFIDPHFPWYEAHNIKKVRKYFAASAGGKQFRFKQLTFADELHLEFQRLSIRKSVAKTPLLATSGAR
jgi:hypothetical protein